MTYYTFNFENAAPAGTQLNTGVVPAFKITIDTLAKCTGWTICVRDTSTGDPGIKAVMLVDDTDGVYFNRPGMKFSNVSFDTLSSAFVAGELHPDYHSSDPYCFKVKFNNPLGAALAPIAIIDNLGNGMILRLRREAPAISLATSPVAVSKPDSIFFPQQKIGNQICTTFVVKNTAADGGTPLLITSATLRKNDAAFAIQSVTPPLPYVLAAQQTVDISLCFTAKDSARHRDSLVVQTDCFSIPISLDAHGLTGLISAADLNFGIIKEGDTLCKNIQIRNVGSAPFTLAKSFVLSDNTNFTVDTTNLPVVINPANSITINVCFHPATAGTYTGGIDWSTDLDASFSHSVKNHSSLVGTATPKQSQGVSASHTTSFSLHPNPSGGNIVVLTLASAETESTTLSIFDVLGREVYRQIVPPDLFHIEIPVGTLSEGVYYVRLNSGSGSLTQKFVKGK